MKNKTVGRKHESASDGARVTSSLARLFPNPALLDILALLLLHPGEAFYQTEIARKTETSILQVQRALARIEGAGLLEKRRRGNRIYYTAEQRHPAFEDLKKVLLKTVALGDFLRAAFSSLGDKVSLAFVFGSIAAGEETRASDVDLLVVGEVSSRKCSTILGPLGREMGREFNTVLYSRKEFKKKARQGNRFIREVLDGPKVWLVGGDNELGRLVE